MGKFNKIPNDTTDTIIYYYNNIIHNIVYIYIGVRVAHIRLVHMLRINIFYDSRAYSLQSSDANSRSRALQKLIL